MKVTEQEFKYAILTVAEALHMTNGVRIYTHHLEHSPLQQTVKLIIFDLFSSGYDHRAETDDEIYIAVKLVREYANELQRNGTVQFNSVTVPAPNNNKLDVYQDMRRIGLSSDQCVEVSDYIEKHFVQKTT